MSTITLKGVGALGKLNSRSAHNAITQVTDRSTAVICQGLYGQIITTATSLAAGIEAAFVVTNGSCKLGSVVSVSLGTNATPTGTIIVAVSTVTAGTFTITYTNVHASEACTSVLTFNFAIVRV